MKSKTFDEDMAKLEKEFSVIEKDIKATSSHVLTYKQVHAMEFPKETWLVDKLIPAKGLTCIGGLPSAMKSYFTNYIASCIAQGKPVLDRFPTQKGNVLFIDKENSLSRLKDRFKKLGLPEDTENVSFMQKNFLIEDKDSIKEVCAYIKDHDINIVFIDTLLTIHQKNENSASEMNQVREALYQFVLAGSAVCFIQHFNKPNANFSTETRHLLRGSGYILGMVDCLIALKQDRPYIEVEQAKTRDAALIPKFFMEPIFTETSASFQFIKEIEDETVVQRVTAEEKIQALLEEGSIRRQTIITELEMFNFSLVTINRALSDLKKRNVIVATKAGKETIYSLKNLINLPL